jgi:hypothetical protein
MTISHAITAMSHHNQQMPDQPVHDRKTRTIRAINEWNAAMLTGSPMLLKITPREHEAHRLASRICWHRSERMFGMCFEHPFNP